MTTMSDLPELACEDCPAVVHYSRGTGLAGPVPVVTVKHEPSCPWMARVAPEGATMSTSLGILIHTFREVA